ncbi:mucin-2 [Drosophila mojavensis]|uniref:mucin-2 n=1 Tax=Drosophila mojavensis TaxID=7230 RepID=UPI001CD07DE4|nr:mucin-2 [Drosophila mojavensis]XP_043867110.1 mucin-2 [Drosophila mojavensis]
MENTTTTMRIEEISSERISGATTINEEIEITTIETPQGIREHHHRHHHHKHHHRHHQQTKEEEEATTLTITDVSDEQEVMGVMEQLEEAEEEEEEEEQHTHHHHHHHQHKHKHKQATPQLSLPPPLPDSSPPYLTPTEEGDQLVWLTDLDASPQQSMASAVQPNPPVIQTPSPTNFSRSQPPATPSPTGTVRQTACIIESQLHLSAPPTPAATTEQTVGPLDSNTPPQQPAPKTVQQQPQQVPSTPNSSGWVVQRLAVVSTQPTSAATAAATATAAAAAAGASPPLTPVTPPAASPSRAAVSQMEIITVTPLRTAAPPAPPMLLVGKVSVDHNDTRSKNYRVSMDSSAAASQGIKKRCCCAIC